ncbi:YVTN family beta-propeller protein [Pedobacter cryoconitis]|uniref:YVTN family beta-propeller protein n=1 Tax=Pedobacter cryoconitis TaxID=188932 RepID=A0A7W8YUW4_9SPHI|nr:YncE family protein [Pedobacter cryoconitis]MBB5622256.1 YVTN family beta-propeller protein [Pedobacter cryoconitis]MBB5647050.1 YVTN family beta-propeller protein [Pedobacter cryoconitis]
MKQKVALALLLLSFCTRTALFAQAKTGIHLLQTHQVSGDEGWDYLLADHAQNKLYISHGLQVNIINETTGDSIGIISNTPGVHGIAIVPALKKGYTSNGKSGECTVFDLHTNAVLRKIKVGDNPDAIFYDDFSKKLFVFNGHSLNVSIIDPLKDQVIATIALGGKPETGVSDGKGKIYVNIEDKNEVVCVDASNLKVIKRFKLTGGEEPSGLAIDRLTSRLFVGCSNKVLIVLDAITGKQITTLPIGEGSDGVVFDPQLKFVYSANGEGTLTVIKEFNANKFQVLENVKTKKGARTIALDEINHHVFLPTADLKAGEGKKAACIPGTFKVLTFGK